MPGPCGAWQHMLEEAAHELVAAETAGSPTTGLAFPVLDGDRFVVETDDAGVEYWRGTRPSQAAKCRALLNTLMSATVAAISDAVIGPMPGIVARRRAVSSPRACATIWVSIVSVPSSNESNC